LCSEAGSGGSKKQRGRKVNEREKKVNMGGARGKSQKKKKKNNWGNIRRTEVALIVKN